nr:hypothetical protein [Tanacetum cinerariifolium]
MSSQQDIYVAGSENRLPMLNKDNYVSWSSLIIRYARREPDHPVLVLESLHKQTDEEETDIKRIDADDQAIQTILLGLPEDVYAAEKKAKLFNEWEKFTSTDGESIKSHYHWFMQLMNDLKRNKHFPKNIASNLKFLNNLQPEWKRHVTIVRQTKNLHEADFTQIYDFLKMNQEEVNELRAERLVKSHDPLALMAHSQNSFNFPTTHKDQSSSSTHPQQSFPINNKYNPQPPLNQNFMIDKFRMLEEMAGISLDSMLVKWHRISKGLMHGKMVGFKSETGNVVAARAEGTGIRNQARCYNYRGLGHIARNCIASPRRKDAAYLQTQLLIAQKEEAGIQLQAEEFDFMAVASISGTQHDRAPIYDTDGSAEVHLNDNFYDNKIFNMFTQEEQYTDLLKPILKPQLVPENDNHVTSVAPIDQVAQVNRVNSNMRATNAELKSELARYKIQEQRVETSQEKYDNLEKCYQNSFIKNKKSSISSLMEDKKKLKHDFKIQEDKFLDKEVDLEARIKDLENILLKRDQTVQTMHMLNPKSDSFYHPNQKMALGYPNPSYLKKAQQKQQSLYNGNLLLKEHEPPDVYDSEETLELAQEIREKMRLLKKEIKPANYAKINHMSGVFVPQTTKSKEELFLSKVSNMVTISKTISIPNEDLSDDTTLSVARKFLNEEATKFVRDFKPLAKEADESLDKQKYLKLEIERLLKASVKKLELCIVKKEKEYAVLWNNWYTKCEECKYDKISYDKAYNDMQQKVERLQAQLRDLKGKSSNTPSVSNTLDPLNKKLESKIVELEFQVVNYEREISHLKTTYKNLFDSIKSNRAHAKLHVLIFENAKSRARLFENTSESVKNISDTSVTPHVDKLKLSDVTPLSKKFHVLMPSHSVPQPREFNVVKHKNVIAPGMFKINPS